MQEDQARHGTTTAPARTALAIPAFWMPLACIVVVTSIGTGARYAYRGDINVIHVLLIMFFTINMVTYFWEWCLFDKHDYIKTRVGYWNKRWRDTGRGPPVDFLTSKVPVRKLVSPTVWADLWASYCHIDPSYRSRSSFGYNVDIGNGVLTAVPVLVLFVAYTFAALPAIVTGILGTMLFWQMAYATFVYWISFFGAGQHTRITRRELYIYIWALFSKWVLFAMLGLYVSIRLILDGNYSVLGF